MSVPDDTAVASIKLTGVGLIGGIWPAPCDRAAAERLIERVGQRWDDAAADLGDPDTQRILQAIGGNSPYLSELAVREFPTFRLFRDQGADAALAPVFAGLDAAPMVQPRSAIAALLRQAKRQAALVIALADIGGLWTVERVTGALTTLAEKTLGLTVRHLLRAAHDKGSIVLPDPDHPDRDSGFVALGMGKLGGRELNYSSDIDLILIYDAEAAPFAETEGIGSLTARLARDLIGLMDARDADGYVFRTDLRLRPDPAATPPAVSLLGALTYYESMGQNWERAAMIKARPVAGDLDLGERFLTAIRPFVWRRGLDFAAVADIHALKRRINAHRHTALPHEADPTARLSGYNVKLGEGGIRDIEFLIQTLQIVWGGRDPSLRVKSTLAAGARLVETGRLDATAFIQLTACYRFFRVVEHRLQMVNDRQTHDLPATPEGMAGIAVFLGFPDAAAFTTELLRHIEVVRTHYHHVFESVPEAPELIAAGPELDFRGDAPAPGTVAALRAMGFADTARVVAGVRRWLAGHVRALRSSRARDLMSLMMPQVLAALGRQVQPDEAFSRFDRFIAALPAGVQPMSLFHRNPILLERVAQVLGAAPILSEHLARYPNALEGLIAGEAPQYAHRVMQQTLRDTTRLEDVIQIVRRLVKERDFLVSVATLDGRLNADAAGRERSGLTHAALRAILPRVLADFASRYGRVPGGDLAIVVLGKAGSLEMMAGSDLDLMFIYDHPPEVTESDGARPMSAGQWFVRAVQACVAALTVPGVEGPMYALDMRLRPSGNKGPLAVSLSAFERYHQSGDAWTWERMALTRARVVAGPPALRARVKAVIRQALCQPRDAGQVRADAASMRARMLKELRPHGPWDVKHRSGGMVDVEFIAQVLQLIHAGTPGFYPNQAAKVALRRLAAAGLMHAADADLLVRADLLWRTIQGVLRLTVGQPDKDALPPASAELLLKAAAKAGFGAADSADLLRKLDEVAQQVQRLFAQLIGGVGG